MLHNNSYVSKTELKKVYDIFVRAMRDALQPAPNSSGNGASCNLRSTARDIL